MSKFKIYDENNNFIGEYVGDFIEDTKDELSDSFDISFGSGCLAILCAFSLKFPRLIFVVIGWFVLRAIWKILKFIGKVVWWLLRFDILCLWWLIRVPITITLDRDVPNWWFPKW